VHNHNDGLGVPIAWPFDYIYLRLPKSRARKTTVARKYQVDYTPNDTRAFSQMRVSARLHNRDSPAAENYGSADTPRAKGQQAVQHPNINAS